MTNSIQNTDLLPFLVRIAEALDRLAPPPFLYSVPDEKTKQAYTWQTNPPALLPIERINRVALPLLKGISQQSTKLIENSTRFALGLPANNALLWGARGMGKSSLVKAVHAHVNAKLSCDQLPLILVEIQREDISSLPRLLGLLQRSNLRRFLLFCDDLSFDADDQSYKSLKGVLEGGIEGRPDNVLFYATSNRRHLMPRDMIENESSTAINPAEAVEEKVSLSDRFGLWLGFHNCDQETFFAMVEGYADYFALHLPQVQLHAEAREWSITRGARSGRVAWQYIQDLAGRLGQTLMEKSPSDQ